MFFTKKRKKMKSLKHLSSENLSLRRTVYTFNILDENGTGKSIGSASVDIIEISEPDGLWPGTEHQIHKWDMSTVNQENRRGPMIKNLEEASLEEVQEAILILEEKLGIWPKSKIRFENHPTLELVTYKAD